MTELLGYHTARAGKELKRDIEVGVPVGQYTPRRADRRCRRGLACGCARTACYTDNHIKIAGADDQLPRLLRLPACRVR